MVILVDLKLETDFAGITWTKKINPFPSSQRCQSLDILSALITKPRIPWITRIFPCAYFEKHKFKQEKVRACPRKFLLFTLETWGTNGSTLSCHPENRRNPGQNIENMSGYEFQSCVHSISNKIQEATRNIICEFITDIFECLLLALI